MPRHPAAPAQTTGRRAGVSAWLIRASAWLVPRDERAQWRGEWLAELHGLGAAAGFRFASGAPAHALWLQKEQWRSDMVKADVTFGWRQVRRRPWLSLAAVVTLALGIGATTVIFSVVYGVLLKPLPYREPARLVQLWETNPLFNWTEANIAPGNLLSWRERNHSFESMAWYFGSDTRSSGTTTLSLEGHGEPARVVAMSVSTNFFDVLGAAPALGRTFAAGEDVAGKNRVVVVSDAFWRRAFGADPDIVNRPVIFNGRTYTIVGVMPAAFAFDNKPADCWLPLVLDFAQAREVRRPHYLRAVARLKPGATIDSARADLAAIASDLAREYPQTNTRMGAGLGPLADWFVGPSRAPLLAFFGAVGLVLFIACVNVANLFLARIGERGREMSLRSALGANRLRLIRQLVAEAGIIAGLGAAAGVALAAGALKLFVRFAPDGLPRLDQIGLNVSVAAFAVAVTAFATLAVGLAPALRASRTDLRAALGDGGRTISGSGRLGRVLVAAEVALAVVLLVGASLTLRSFVALTSVRTSFNPQSLVSARLSLPGIRYGDPYKSANFFEALQSKLQKLPGVTGAGATGRLPLDGVTYTSQFYIEGRPEFHGYELRHGIATSGFFDALGVPLTAGRLPTLADSTAGLHPIVVNESFVRQYFPQGDVIGRRIAYTAPDSKTQWESIVGVVADMPQDGLGVPTVPEIVEPEIEQDTNEMSVLVRSTMPPAEAIAALRRAIHEMDGGVAIFDVRSMSDRIWESVARERLAMWLAGAFALSALVLAAVGIFSVAAQSVAARTREIGVRVAFGATRGHVLGLVIRRELFVVAAGLAAGGAAAFAISRVITSMLFGVTPGDPVSYGLAASALAGAAIVACLVPARRAVGVDPITALRQD